MQKNIFKNGIISQNPTFKLVLGMCPTLAVTTTLINGIGMGLATMFVLIFSNMLISLLKNIIPDKIRIPAFIIIIATFVTIVDMVMKKFTPDLYESLGVFIPLIVVNCIIFARAEAFASANTVADSVFDGLSMGLGFTLSLSIISMLRELLSAGTILGITILGNWFPKIAMFALPAGGFLMLGLLMAAFIYIYKEFEQLNKKKYIKSSELRYKARKALSKHWIFACLSTFIISLLIFVSILTFMSYFLIIGSLCLSLSYIFINIIRNNKVHLKSIFFGFDHYVNSFLLGIKCFGSILLWSLFFIIPGIIKSYSYSMCYYIMVDNTKLNSKSIINKSIKMMHGNKLRLFCLDLSFIGWMLLSLLTCGIGFIWLLPYIKASHVQFYENLKLLSNDEVA